MKKGGRPATMISRLSHISPHYLVRATFLNLYALKQKKFRISYSSETVLIKKSKYSEYPSFEFKLISLLTV